MGLVALHDIVLLSPYTPNIHSLLGGIDIAVEHVISFEGERYCYISFRAGTGFDRAPVA